jgi:toxin ParE1/3/4
MTWRVFSRPEIEKEVIEIAEWYDARGEGLGERFVEEVLAVLNELTINPLLNCRRHPSKNIRWRYPKSFPYRVIYEVIEVRRLWSWRQCYTRPGMIENGSDESERIVAQLSPRMFLRSLMRSPRASVETITFLARHTIRGGLRSWGEPLMITNNSP